MMHDAPRRLRRSHDRKIAGVAGGIADYLELDPTLVRLGFVLLVLLGLGTAVVAYAVLWLVMPPPDAADARDSGASAPAAAPQSRLLLVVLAVVLVVTLAGGFAWVGLLSAQLLRLSLPLWIVVLAGGYLLLRSRRSRTS